MKERPILMSAPMVRAILDGTKTQTRRIISPRPQVAWQLKACGILTCEAHKLNAQQVAVFDRLDGFNQPYKCPYGQPGDQLWVRETWQGPLLDEEQREEFRQDGSDAFKKPEFCAYRATDTLDAVDDDGKELGWRPSIHMPRWASRIQLEITDIRVERLQDISEADAIAEGIEPNWLGDLKDWKPEEHGWINYLNGEDGPEAYTAKESYQSLWESINGAGSWNANPWVWCITFRRLK